MISVSSLEAEIDSLVLGIAELDVFGAEAYKRSIDWYSSWVDEEERTWSSSCESMSSSVSSGSSSGTVVGRVDGGRSRREVYTPSPASSR